MKIINAERVKILKMQKLINSSKMCLNSTSFSKMYPISVYF